MTVDRIPLHQVRASECAQNGVAGNILDILICPRCRSEARLALSATEETDDGVVCGNLNCGGCGARYPVTAGIPRFVAPTEEPDFVREQVQQLGLHGFKVYHNRASIEKTFDADIPLYFPEWLAELADKMNFGVTLHMVKERGVADPSNIHWIRHYCQTYPGMKLILAHSARGFQPSHKLEGLPQLSELDNVYFDCSANCEPMAHQAIIRIMGHKRLMWGADFPVSHMRGRSLGAADSFIWLYGDTPVWNQNIGGIEPTLVGIENLRSMKYACWSERLSDSQVEDIFLNNAAELFGVE